MSPLNWMYSSLYQNFNQNIPSFYTHESSLSSYTSPEEPEGFTYRNYRKLLDDQVPTLFSGKYKVITEFGRSLLLKAVSHTIYLYFVRRKNVTFWKVRFFSYFKNQNSFLKNMHLPECSHFNCNSIKLLEPEMSYQQ